MIVYFNTIELIFSFTNSLHYTRSIMYLHRGKAEFLCSSLKSGCTYSPVVSKYIARIEQYSSSSQANYFTFDWSCFWCHCCASEISASFSLRELGELAECARRPLFSIVLSRGLMIHVLIHVLCCGSRYPCSQYWIIKALCACRSHCPSFVFSLLSGSHSLSFVYSCFPLCLSVFEPNFKLHYLDLSRSLL